jgi:hypothetical protein
LYFFIRGGQWQKLVLVEGYFPLGELSTSLAGNYIADLTLIRAIRSPIRPIVGLGFDRSGMVIASMVLSGDDVG